MLEKARLAERLTAERTTASERFERYRQAVETHGKIVALEAAHPSPTPLPVLRPRVDELRKVDDRIRELKAMLSGEIEVHYEVEAPEPTWRATAIIGLVGVLAGAVVAIANAVEEVGVLLGPAQFESGIVVGVAILAVGMVISLLARRQRLRAQDWRREQQLRSTEIDRRLRGRSQLEEELKHAEADAARRLLALELPDLAAAQGLLEQEEAHVREIERLSAQLDGLVGKEPPDTVPGLRDAAALEVEQKTGALEALGPIAKEPRARERLEVEVRDAEAALDRARDDEAHAAARVEANAVDADQVAGHAERLAAWRGQLAALQRRVRVYEATLRAIEHAEQATMKTATRYLEARMAKDVIHVTGGRYRRVEVNDKTLDIRLFAPEKGDWVDVRDLSQGTLDLVYLVARLGLTRLVTGDRRPPLVMDDPFVTLDDDRATRAIALLRELAADFQVVYLTTSMRYDELADRVVVLEGPTGVDDAAPADDVVVPAAAG
jgi:hypothetical protein